MSKRLSNAPAYHKLSNTRLRLFILSGALLAFPFVSAQGQRYVTSSSRPCVIGLNNQVAFCSGWAVCEDLFRRTQILGSMRTYQTCPGYIVHNFSTVFTLADRTGLGAEGSSHLYGGSGATLGYNYVQQPCQGVKRQQRGTVNQCPSPPGGGSLPSDTFLLVPMPLTQDACEAVSWAWNSFTLICAPRPTDPEDCQWFGWNWNYTSATCQEEPWYCDMQPTNCQQYFAWSTDQCRCVQIQSPVLIDVLGNGISLTDGPSGVLFDLNSDGVKEKLSWTAQGVDDAWLVLDRNNNSTIDNGQELFGNFTPQPEPASGEEKNGFVALAEWDKTGHGGNDDGTISQDDSVFGSLRLWQDGNQNGISEAGELHKLQDLGITTLELAYKESKRTDQYGNEFRYRAKVKDTHNVKVGRWAWDVFLLSGK